MRRDGLTAHDVQGIVARPEHTDADAEGRIRHTGTVNGRRFRVVLAVDQRGLVVTVHPRKS
jgi:hypothetical protein